MNWTPSLRKAVLIPFIAIILIILLIIGLVWKNDYDWLLKEQGGRTVHGISDNTADRFSSFLKAPLQASRLYTAEIQRMAYYESGNMDELARYSLDFAKALLEESPQISVISLGDESGNYLGIRMDSTTRKVNLMRKDSHTEGLLRIFEGEDTQSKVLAEYSNYDPRLRPWYVPVKNNPARQWSSIYINYDEKMEATLSILNPIFDASGVFRGTTDIDVKLDGMNRFLQENKQQGSGAIYMVDQDGYVLAHSAPDPIATVVPGDPPTGTFTKAIESQNPLIRQSALKIAATPEANNTPFELSLDGGRVMGLKVPIDPSLGLGWHIITVIPESDLVGQVKSHQLTSLIVLSLSVLLLFAAGAASLSMTTQSIIQVTKAISKPTQGQLGSPLDVKGKGIQETQSLIEAFNKMIARLNASFGMLRDSEEKYRTLVESSNDIIYSLDPSGRFISVNSSFEEKTGISRSEILGKDISFVLTSDEDRMKWQNDFEKAVSGKRTITSLSQLLQPNGSSRIYNIALTPILNETGELIAVIGTHHDVSRLLEIESEKIAAMSYIVSGIAHEMNTPIGNCITTVTYLKSELSQYTRKHPNTPTEYGAVQELLDTTRESADLIYRNLEKSMTLIEEFKTLAVVKNAESEASADLTDLMQVIQQSFNEISVLFPDKTVQLSLQPDQPLWVDCSEKKIIKVFSELFENSFQHGFSETDHGNIDIHVFGPNANGEMSIRYRDNGIGISKEISPLVFTPFFSTKFGAQHSGLGLNVVYNIIKAVCNGDVIVNENYTDGMELTLIVRMPTRLPQPD